MGHVVPIGAQPAPASHEAVWGQPLPLTVVYGASLPETPVAHVKGSNNQPEVEPTKISMFCS